MATSILVFSDLHVGHKLAILPKDTKVTFDGDGFTVVSPNEYQRFLYEFVFEELGKIASQQDIDKTVVLFNGDIVQGNKRPDEVAVPKVYDQIQLAFNLVEELLAVIPSVSSVRFLLGTASHEFGEGSATQTVATLTSKSFPDVSVNTYYHGELEVDDVIIDIAHHGVGAGNKIYTKGNSFRSYIRNILLTARENDYLLPDIIIRGHYHEFVLERVYDNDFQPHDGFISPSLVIGGDYMRRATASLSTITVGFVEIKVYDNKLWQIIPHVRKIDLRKREVL